MFWIMRWEDDKTFPESSKTEERERLAAEMKADEERLMEQSKTRLATGSGDHCCSGGSKSATRKWTCEEFGVYLSLFQSFGGTNGDILLMRRIERRSGP